MCDLGWQMCEGEQQQPPRLNPLYRGGLPSRHCQPALTPATNATLHYGRGIVRHHMLERAEIIEQLKCTNSQPHIQPHITHDLTSSDPSPNGVTSYHRSRPRLAHPRTRRRVLWAGLTSFQPSRDMRDNAGHVPSVPLIPPHVSIKKDPALTGSSCPDMQAAERLTLCHHFTLTAR